MRCKKFLFFGVLLFVAVFAFGYELNYYQNQFSFYPDRGFDRISAPDFLLKGYPGHPELPVKCLHYIIPANTMVESISVTDIQMEQIPGSYYLYPAQPDAPLCSIPPWVPPDSVIYNSDSLYPGKVIEIVNHGVFDGASLVTIVVCPLQYRPQSRRVFLVSHIAFEFEFSGGKSQNIPNRGGMRGVNFQRVRGVNTQKTYDAALSALVENYWEVPVYYQPPILIPDPPPESDTVAYIIITNDTIPGMVQAFQPFADWLTDKGVPAKVIPLSDALHYPGNDDAEKLRNFIKDAYNKGTAWVLLGGDAGIVPFRKGCADTFSTSDENTPPSDLYFSDMNGNWDVDGDLRWGEPHDLVDVYPEVFVGRVLVRNPEEVQNWVNKILYYERYGSKTPSLFQHTGWIYDSLSCAFPSWMRLMFPNYFEHHNYDSVDADVAVGALSIGFGLYQVYCHGKPAIFYPRRRKESGNSTMVHSYWGSGGNSQNHGLNYLENDSSFYVVYSVSCYNAAYDNFNIDNLEPTDTTIADGFTDTYAQKGAIAFLGNTRLGWYTGSAHLHYVFCQYFFDFYGRYPSLGVAEGLSKTFLYCCVPWAYHAPPPLPAVDEDWYVTHSHNLFGSPETEPWINIPNTLTVEHPSFIPVGETVKFTVTVSTGGSPLSGVRVCLNKPDDIYKIGWTDNSGSVTFEICAQSEGVLKVTSFRPRQGTTQFLPSQTSCDVRRGGGGGQAERSGLPKELSLSISSPVSTSGNLRLTYGLPKEERLKLAVYDLSGRMVMMLKDEMKKAGYYSEAFKLKQLSNGIYWVILKSESGMRTRKLVLVK